MQSLEIYQIYKNLKVIKSYQGIGTELISLYLPGKKSKSEIINKLKLEFSQADNIKSKSTKKIVKKGLDSLISYLKVNSIPKKGLLLFSHYDKVFSISPISQNFKYSYNCDSRFVLPEFSSLLKFSEKFYGLLVLDSSQAAFGILSNNNLTIIKEFQSYIPGKTKKGGQSARRYSEIRKNETLEFFKKIIECINSTVVPKVDKLVKLYIAGISPTIDQFINLHPDLDYRIVNKLSSPYKITYTNKLGLKSLTKLISKELEYDDYARQLDILDKINNSRIYTDIFQILNKKLKISKLVISQSLKLNPIYFSEKGYTFKSNLEIGKDPIQEILVLYPNLNLEIIPENSEVCKIINSLYSGFIAY
jgi:peptide chain release factor subunit 1